MTGFLLKNWDIIFKEPRQGTDPVKLSLDSFFDTYLDALIKFWCKILELKHRIFRGTNLLMETILEKLFHFKRQIPIYRHWFNLLCANLLSCLCMSYLCMHQDRPK